jgi:uncharacterized protein (DUF58 family)
MNFQQLESQARQLTLPLSGTSGEIVGAGRVVLRGRGLTFAAHREYQYGDDVRTIDWNATARFARPFVKTFHEDRSFDLLILVDVSASLGPANNPQTKSALGRELAALFTFVALQQDQRVALTMFSDDREWQKGLGRGRAHVNTLLHALLHVRPKSRRTDLRAALNEADRQLGHPGLVILISDFVDAGYEDALRRMSRKHDVFAVALDDSRDAEPPDVGLVRVRDAENGTVQWMDTSTRATRQAIRANWVNTQANRHELFKRARIAGIDILVDRPYFKILRAACRGYRGRRTA